MYSITTNNVPRDITEGWELPTNARSEFDYIDWEKAEVEGFGGVFVKYRNEWFHLNEFERVPEWLNKLGWDGWQPQSAFSAILVKYVRDGNESSVVLGYLYF